MTPELKNQKSFVLQSINKPIFRNKNIQDFFRNIIFKQKIPILVDKKTKKASPQQQQIQWFSKALKMGVSKNWGTPKWMVYNGKPY